MLATILSDNYYFLTGIKSSKNLPIHLSHNSNLQERLAPSSLVGNIIIAVECIQLRIETIEFIKSQTSHYYVLLPEIIKNKHFKIGEVIYASMKLTTEYLHRITTIKTSRPRYLLTQRESQILELSYLKNISIARILSLSEKTISTYRRSISSKFNLNLTNHMAMIRIQKTIAPPNIQYIQKNINYGVTMKKTILHP
ncbi:TPA: response regulator transcription factor [Enterobacter hormaechei subsp. hoffmannii]|nr:hypothetical protein [Enterobacter hormaechei]